MKISVCELGNNSIGLKQDWLALIEHVTSEKSDLVLLPEMTFHPWLAGTNQIKPELWQEAVNSHDHWLGRLSELTARIVIGSRPVIQNKSLSSNFNGPNITGSEFGGTGWVIEPEEGSVLGVTSPGQPFLTVEIDLEVAQNAKNTYPRYVKE